MSPASEEKKPEAIADSLRERVSSGEFGTGGRLPSVAQLARDHQTTRPTIYQAIALLQGEGLVISKGNSFYVHHVLRVPTSVIPTFEQVLAAQKLTFLVRNLIDPEIILMPDEIALMFGQPTGLHVVHRLRLQGREDLPYRLSEYWYPVELARSYLQELKDNPEYDALEAIKRDLGVTLQAVHDDVIARLTTKEEAGFLSISRSTPVQEIRRTNQTLEGKVLMHHRIVFVGPLSILSYDYQIVNR